MIQIPYYKNMTNDMKEVADATLDEEKLKFEFLLCHQMYLKAKEAGKTSLPRNTETGEPVLHGARQVMHQLENYWEIRRDAIKEFLPKEWIEKQGVNAMSFKK